MDTTGFPGPGSALAVRLLGVPEASWAGKPLVIPRRQPRAILYRLAYQMGPVSRAHLCMLLWPDRPDSDARRHLSNQLYNLRRALPVPGVVQTTNSGVGLDAEKTWSDLVAFRRLTKSASTTARKRAVDLYRGPFMDGFALVEDKEFSLWVDNQRRILEREYLDALSALIDAYAAAGNHKAAIACANQYLAIDELAEGVHRRLIDLYVRSGKRNAAQRQYERCAAALERELGVDPLPATRAAFEAIMGEQATATHPQVTPPAWKTLPGLETPLVGREWAMQRLQHAYVQARDNAGVAVLVTGEAGVGKSRLLQEFVTQQSAQATIVTGSGYEAQGEIPFLPLVEALRPLLPTIDWHALHANPLQLAQLTSILPELRHHVPNLPEPTRAIQEQGASPLFHALAHLMLRVAGQNPPLVLCFDDLHWIDATTRSWLGYFGRFLHRTRIILLGAYRTEADKGVKSLITTLARLEVLEHVHLHALREKDVRELIHRLSGQTGGEDFCRHLQQQTGGNPFYLLEALRALFEAGVLRQEENNWLGDLDDLRGSGSDLLWTDTLEATIDRRLARLRPVTTQVLEAGAVLGQRFDLDLVQATSGRSANSVVAALDELVARQLIVNSSSGYAFKHGLVLTFVRDGLSDGRRRLLQRRAGEALEAQEPENVGALARHFANAGVTRKAIRYALKAGEEAFLIYAYSEAADHYRRAVKLLKREGEEERAARALLRLGLVHHYASQFGTSRAIYTEATELRKRVAALLTAHSLPPAPHPLRLFFFTDDPRRLDPGQPWAAAGIVFQLFSGLVRAEDGWTIQPDVARSWEVGEHGSRYVFHLREDARWTDGEPLTAHDFVYAWKRILDLPASQGRAEALYAIRGAERYHCRQVTDFDAVAVRAVDAHTLQVHLEKPAGYFLNLLASHALFPVPRHVVSRHGDAWTRPEHIVCNGPFRLQDWEPGKRLILARNPAYVGHFSGNLTQLEFILHDNWSPSDQLEAYRRGRVDMVELAQETIHVRRQHPEMYRPADYARTVIVAFGSAKPPFDDRRVRRALSLAVDRDEFGRQAKPGLDIPAKGGFLPPDFPGHSPDLGLPFDPEAARRLLAKAGFPGGKGFPRAEILTSESREEHAQFLRQAWRQHLGIQLQVNAQAWAVLDECWREKPLFIIAWAAIYPDPDYFLRVGVHNLAHWWEDPQYEVLIAEAARLRDPNARLRLYRQADRILTEEAAVIPLLHSTDHYLIQPWLNVNPARYRFEEAVLVPH